MDRPAVGPDTARQGTAGGRNRFRPSDVLMLECPFTETSVTEVSRFHLSVTWPWNQVDPQAENIRWNGQRALPRPDAHEWDVFRTEPPGTVLKPGATCLVGIPATVVHVLAIHDFDPPW